MSEAILRAAPGRKQLLFGLYPHVRSAATVRGDARVDLREIQQPERVVFSNGVRVAATAFGRTPLDLYRTVAGE